MRLKNSTMAEKSDEGLLMFMYLETVNLDSARGARIMVYSFNSNFKLCMNYVN